ncbi:winged helix-turn-helix transcriptional regulator [Clostridium sp. 19966]|uniref:MarR family winged helix-turn-helix transcriptional regulator n=1 Tax=Clostridium sp. 19966 TaxID=2768166 RepID=UPI0028DD5B98|nr:MarR family winged helix-turn-helix transcriptional regulator [Clostridium sp. 19966]MDT8715118.1 winged helix-turn-helix transcriptional regulator [Clostridium sp. 19966]
MDNYRKLYLMQQNYATLFSLVNKVQVKGDQKFAVLTSRQLMTIIAILHLPEDETTLNNIAKKLGTTKQSVKQVINILENKGYVITVSSPKDKRAVNVKLTEEGRKVTIECGKNSIDFFPMLFKGFSIEELETLWKLLKKLYSFDGEEQDGFEENVNFAAEEFVDIDLDELLNK